MLGYSNNEKANKETFDKVSGPILSDVVRKRITKLDLGWMDENWRYWIL